MPIPFEIKALIMLEHSDEQVSEPFKIEPIHSDFKFVLSIVMSYRVDVAIRMYMMINAL